MKPLLAISWEMPPMYGPRAMQVSRVLSELPANGWSPTVVCMDPKPDGPHWFDAAGASPSKLRLVRIPSAQELFAVRAIWRMLPSLRDYPDTARLWIRPAARAAIAVAHSETPAVIISFAQPWSDHLIGLRVHRSTHLPWVAHFSDPWADSPYATPRQRSIWRGMEANVVREATALVFVTQETADVVMEKYPDAWRAKVSVVPHGFDPRVPAKDSEPTDRSRPLRLVYTGRFYRGVRTPLALLEALAILNRQSPIAGQLELSLIGPEVDDYLTDARRLGVAESVKFRGRIAPSAAAAAAAQADVLLIIDASSDGASMFLPSKLVDYLPFRKPILGLTPPRGASANLLRRLHCPIVQPDDTNAIASAISDLLGRWRSGTLAVDTSFAATAAEFDIRNTSRLLSDVLARACA
jgi:glycosyltransferase involved in cell wall biosynthesis